MQMSASHDARASAFARAPRLQRLVTAYAIVAIVWSLAFRAKPAAAVSLTSDCYYQQDTPHISSGTPDSVVEKALTKNCIPAVHKIEMITFLSRCNTQP